MREHHVSASDEIEDNNSCILQEWRFNLWRMTEEDRGGGGRDVVVVVVEVLQRKTG